MISRSSSIECIKYTNNSQICLLQTLKVANEHAHEDSEKIVHNHRCSVL